MKDWYWCMWNEPNNLIVGGDLTFAQYRRIYEEVAADILRQLEPYLGGRKAMIGGPAIDGTHRSYWMDWIARLVTEVDNRMIGFVSWHRYGDWRPAVPSASLELEMWDSPDAPSGAVFEALLMAQTPDYEARARGVARLLKGRDILNVCGELNTISHHENYYTLGLNQNVFGAAYYASALIDLLRGGADLEMRWTATSHDEHTDAYGLMTMNGDPTPACLAKQLFAQHVRYGDLIRFPRRHPETPDVDAVVAGDGNGRRSGVFVNMGSRPRQLTVSDWDDGAVGLQRCPAARLEHRRPGGPGAVRRHGAHQRIRRRGGDRRGERNPGRLRPASSANDICDVCNPGGIASSPGHALAVCSAAQAGVGRVLGSNAWTRHSVGSGRSFRPS